VHSERSRIDDVALALALGALGLVMLAFFAAGNGAAFVMVAICISGIASGRLIGIRGTTLLPVAIGLALLLWMLWNYPPGGPHATSAFAHFFGGALAGWALAVTLRRSLTWPAWAIVALLGAVALAGVWEVAEWAGDRVLETGLVPSKRDSAFDAFFGVLGAAAAIVGVGLATRRDQDGPSLR
jgi:hypothetical protein